MTNWLFMFWGKARAMAVLIILPIAMYSFGGFAPSVDAKLDTKDVERQYEDWKKDRGLSNEDCSQDYSNGHGNDPSDARNEIDNRPHLNSPA
jgi:hypothetical protein